MTKIKLKQIGSPIRRPGYQKRILIGLGLGPLLFGILSDSLQPVAGVESVRWVLYGAAWLGLIPAFFFWRASLRLKDELKSG